MAARTTFAPGSDWISARTAELSRTYLLLTLRFRVPLRDQLIRQRNALGNISPYDFLSSPNPGIDRLNDQCAIDDARYQPISGQKAEFAAQCLRDHHFAICGKGDNRGRVSKCIDISHGKGVYHGNELAQIRAESRTTEGK